MSNVSIHSYQQDETLDGVDGGHVIQEILAAGIPRKAPIN